MTLFKKLFVGGDWHIATRKNMQSWPFDYDIPFVEIKGEKRYWYADPLLFEYRGGLFLFCEAFNQKRQAGEICVFSYNGQDWVDPRIIISPNYHVSYPCVFEYDGECYMIPESQEAKCIEIYKSEAFPYKWVKIKNLQEDCVVADPTVVKHDGKLFLLGYMGSKPYKLSIYGLDMNHLSLQPIDVILYDENCGRPAGKLIPYHNSFIRPSQDCRYIYGDSIIWNNFEVNSCKFKENAIGGLDKGRIKVVGAHHVDRVHTYDRCGDVEVIDYNIYTFDLYKRIRILWKKYKRWRRN